MNDKAVDELVAYLAHCNRKEHLVTAIALVRRVAAMEAKSDDAHELAQLLLRQRNSQNQPPSAWRPEDFDPLQVQHHAGY